MKVIPTWHLIRKHWFVSAALLIVSYVGVSKTIDYLTPPKEIALIIGEPWKNMQARSTATIGDEIPGHNWNREPRQLSYLRFADNQYGFVTPPAKFFTVSFDDKGLVEFIRMSPQVEPLPLKDTLDIILNLQDQWAKSGWDLDDSVNFPAYQDSPFWIQVLKDCRARTTHWDAGEQYQLMVVASCFEDRRYPKEQRYLITISMGPYDKERERPFRKR
ncbi:hypothetical protein NQT62_08465 [Limnobacter humi]|uniref:Uncharacterized protein n=1 Tax=Limnobacter humi TaxID=1778671 RepID=A0ABT1WG19_9BURK|nr:hypothetical protein [Limnobacter humi]MCQ8896463.1 hypothetical protein [Limnobacter humi]